MSQMNKPDCFQILGGPRDGQMVQLPPGQKTWSVMILHDPKILAQMADGDIVKTSQFDYRVKEVRIGSAWMEILVPAFWSDAEALLSLSKNIHPNL